MLHGTLSSTYSSLISLVQHWLNNLVIDSSKPFLVTEFATASYEFRHFYFSEKSIPKFFPYIHFSYTEYYYLNW